MKVLFTTLREQSHFLALTPYIEACRRQGHEVAVAAPADFAGRVAPTGATFFAVGHPGDEGLRPIWARFRDAPMEEINQIAIKEIFAGACAGAAIPSVVEILARFQPAIVLRESFEFSGLVAAEKSGVPHARIAICAPGAEADVRRLVTAPVDGHLREVGLPPDPTGERLQREPALTLFPPSFDPPEATAAPLLRYRTPAATADPLPEWWGAQGGPLLYLTLGTVSGRFEMMRDRYRTLLAAFAALPVRALLTTGSDLPPDFLGEVPPNVHVERFVPQKDVLPCASAVVFHGGSGTALGALAAGLPMVVTPIFADQPHNARRVAATGTGLALFPADLQVETLRAAVSRVLAEPSFRDAARTLASEIAALPSLDQVAADIERLARSR
jgi:UDP:flavonoid glycosyltransferase YjiC (YdhE family)